MPRGVNKEEGISYWVAGSYIEAQGERETKFHGVCVCGGGGSGHLQGQLPLGLLCGALSQLVLRTVCRQDKSPLLLQLVVF